MKKKLLTVLCAVGILWGALFATDYLRVSHFREPIFVFRGVSADDGGSYVGHGPGYTVAVKKYLHSNGSVTLESVTMTIFGRVITAAIT